MKILQILKNTWLWVTGKYKNLTSQDNLDAAIEAVNVIKSLSYSQVAGWLVQLTATDIDNRILDIIKDRAPKAISALLLLKHLPDKPDKGEIETVIKSFLMTINNDVEERGRLLTSLTASILIALEDGKLTFGEAAAIVEKAYQENQN